MSDKIILIAGLALVGAGAIFCLVAFVLRPPKAPGMREAPSMGSFNPTLRLRSLNLPSQIIAVIDSVDYVIGRDEDCNLRLNMDNTISGQHCRIEFNREDKTHYATDLDSKNRTYLNGKAMEPLKPYAIRRGNTISFSSEVDFQIESAFKE